MFFYGEILKIKCSSKIDFFSRVTYERKKLKKEGRKKLGTMLLADVGRRQKLGTRLLADFGRRQKLGTMLLAD